jgi:hypothetical protein
VRCSRTWSSHRGTRRRMRATRRTGCSGAHRRRGPVGVGRAEAGLAGRDRRAVPRKEPSGEGTSRVGPRPLRTFTTCSAWRFRKFIPQVQPAALEQLELDAPATERADYPVWLLSARLFTPFRSAALQRGTPHCVFSSTRSTNQTQTESADRQESMFETNYPGPRRRT